MKRSAPAVHVLVERFGLWTAGIWALLLLSAASLVAWFADAAQAAGGWWPMMEMASTPVMFFMLAAALALACPLFLLHAQAVSLRWDGQAWLLGPTDRVGDEPWPAELAVRMDLGGWMLLRVRSSAPGFPSSRAWLPLQKRGLAPAQWHGLRCALFAARPGPSSTGAGEE